MSLQITLCQAICASSIDRTAVKQKSPGAILLAGSMAVATEERRLGDESKANMPEYRGQKKGLFGLPIQLYIR